MKKLPSISLFLLTSCNSENMKAERWGLTFFLLTFLAMVGYILVSSIIDIISEKLRKK